MYTVCMSSKQKDLFKKAPKTRANISIPADLWASFGKRAESMEVSRSVLIEMMINEFLEEGRQLSLSSKKGRA